MIKYLLFLCVLPYSCKVLPHPMPSSIVELSVLENTIRGEAKIPLVELGNAVGNQQVTYMSDPIFIAYFTTHIQASFVSTHWNTKIDRITVVSGRIRFDTWPCLCCGAREPGLLKELLAKPTC